MPARIDVTVRPAGPADYGAIRSITVDAYVTPGYVSGGYVRRLADVEHRAASTDLLVATLGDGGPVVGAVALAVRGGPYSELTADGEAAFRMLAVAPAAQGLGAGSALVLACLERARAAGCRRMVISTQPEMAAAQRLYRRLGFVRAPERDWSPEPGIDLLVYQRQL